MAWEKYSRLRAKVYNVSYRPGNRYISVYKGSNLIINISGTLLKNLNIAYKYNFCNLYYDTEKNLLGIRMNDTPNEDSLRIFNRNNGYTQSIGFKRFANAYGLKFDEGSNYYDTQLDETGMIVVDFNKKIKRSIK